MAYIGGQHQGRLLITKLRGKEKGVQIRVECKLSSSRRHAIGQLSFINFGTPPKRYPLNITNPCSISYGSAFYSFLPAVPAVAAAAAAVAAVAVLVF